MLGNCACCNVFVWHLWLVYRIVKNFGGKKVWRICLYKKIGEKTLANL